MDIEARTDDTHREILGLLPHNLFDFSNLEQGIEQLLMLLGATPVELPASVEISDHVAQATDGHEITVRLYRPTGVAASSPALFWIHGGGMILGSVAMDDPGCAAFAEQLGIIIASVEYRLAPAFPHPIPVEDCYSGLAWLFASAESLGIDPARIAIGGASAGGGLAAGLAIAARDRGEVQPCFQLLRYPMIDDTNTTASSHAITDGRVWNRDANIVAWNAYLSGRAGADDIDVYAAPARATELSGLPPAIVTVGDLDLFLDEDISYAQKLLAAGVPTELHVYPGAFHASDAMVPHSDASQRWRRDELAALTRALGL